MRYLITPSLLNARDYFLANTERENAESEFLTTLRREPIPDNEFMRAGRTFENAVKVYMLIGKFDQQFDDAYNACVKEVADMIQGGTWGMKDKREITIGEIDFLLYGRFDVVRRETVFDIKFKCGQYEHGDFQDSNQHVMYLALLPGCEKFEYLISNGRSVFTETYYRKDVRDINQIVALFWSWLNAFPKYGDIFKDKWQAL